MLLLRINLMQRLAPPGPNLVSSKTPRSAPHTTAISETVAFSTTSILSASLVLKDGLLESAGSRKPEAGCVHLASCSRQSGRKPILLSPALRWKWGWHKEGSYLRRRSAATGSKTPESWRKIELKKCFPREAAVCQSRPVVCSALSTITSRTIWRHGYF